MTLKRLGIVIAAAALLASPALAQLKRGFGKALNEAEAKVALLGIDMQGYSPTWGFSWRECIQPNGETLYETPDRVVRGQLSITPTGEACFSYEDTEYSTVACYVTYKTGGKTGDGLRFESERDGLFLTTKLVTGVKTCKPRQLLG